MRIQGPGEGWVDIFGQGYQWIQVYDRRSETPIPVVLPPSGGTQPLVPDPPPVQVPPVVPGPRPTFNNQIPPPLIPARDTYIPPDAVGNNEDETVALEDWFQTGVDLANVWGRTRVAPPFTPQQFVSSTPVAAPAGSDMAVGNGAMPRGMYIDSHGHLVHRRRRRRPCITQTDLALAWQISNLPNNANVKMFLAKCVK